MTVSAFVSVSIARTERYGSRGDVEGDHQRRRRVCRMRILFNRSGVIGFLSTLGLV